MGSYIYFISVSKELLVPASALSCVSCVHFSWLCTFHAHVYACKYFFNPFFQKWHRGALTQPHIFSFWWRPGRKSSLTEWWSWTALSSLAGRHSNRPRGWTMPFLRVVGIDIWCNKRYNKNISGVLSAKHGLLFYDNQRFWFKDTNSRNGSWLNNVFFHYYYHFQCSKMRLKNPPRKIGQMFKKKGGGVKGLLNNVKKNCIFLKGWLP